MRLIAAARHAQDAPLGRARHLVSPFDCVTTLSLAQAPGVARPRLDGGGHAVMLQAVGTSAPDAEASIQWLLRSVPRPGPVPITATEPQAF